MELDLEAVDDGTVVRVTESRPLEILTVRGRELAEELGLAGGAARRPPLPGAGPALMVG